MKINTFSKKSYFFVCFLSKKHFFYVFLPKRSDAIMNVVLEQSFNNVRLYVDKNIVTIFDDKNIDEVIEWIKRNLSNVNVYIACDI